MLRSLVRNKCARPVPPPARIGLPGHLHLSQPCHDLITAPVIWLE